MALSGSFTVSSGVSWFWAQVDWSATQNVSANTSTITMRTYVKRKAGSSAYNMDGFTVTQAINGNNYNSTATFDLRSATSQQIASRSYTIGHNSDGTKTFSIGVNIPTGISGIGTLNRTVNFDLNKIPRAYDFLVSTRETAMDSNFIVKVNDNGSGFSARMYYYFGNKKLLINGNMPIGSNYNFTFQSKDWADQIPNSTLGDGSVYIETWNGGTKIGESKVGVRLTLPSNIVPTISGVTYADQNSTVTSVTGSDQILIAGMSTPRMNVQASGIYGSTISQFKFECNGNTLTNAGYLKDIPLNSYNLGTGNVTVKVTVTDSRGRTATANDVLDIRPYSQPSLTNFSADRSTTTNTTIVVTKGVSVSSIKNGTAEKNTYTVKTETKKSTDTAWTTVNTETNTSANFNLTGYSATDSYDIRITVTDRLGAPVVVTANVSTDSVLIDLYQDIGVGIGKYYESGHGALDVGDMIYMLGRSLLNTFYPVGSIYQSTSSTSPSTFMGGTWERFAKGQVLVGVDESDGDFNTPNKTGGEKTHTLTGTEMPEHNHRAPAWDNGQSYFWRWGSSSSRSNAVRDANSNAGAGTFSGGNPLFTIQGNEGLFTQGAGGSGAHNNVQPYVTVYTWRRTA